MSNFSNREDRHLGQLAWPCELGCKRIVWQDVAKCMKYAKKDSRTLRMRLNTLKTTHGKSLQGFPPWFFVDPKQVYRSGEVHLLRKRAPRASPACRSSALSVAHEQLAHTHGQPIYSCDALAGAAHSNAMALTQLSPVVGLTDQPQSVATYYPLTSKQSHDAVRQIFSGVCKSDVRQTAGRTETNVGEIAAEGVTELIRVCALGDDDVFLDVGSRIGNMVAQVALESSVKLSVGVEIRRDVAMLSQEALTFARAEHVCLARTLVLEGDIRAFEEQPAEITPTTVLLSSNLLFSPIANESLHRLCCQLPYLRLVVLIYQVCRRHKRRCKNEFCSVWSLQASATTVATQFKSAPLKLFVYEKVKGVGKLNE